jgi:hypothetical protein
MTAGPREQKRMWVADVVLRRAARLVPITLPDVGLPTDLDSIDVTAARAGNLANLNRLETLGCQRGLRGGFWRDLMRACEMLELPDRMAALTSHYRAALQRVGAPTTRDQIAREREALKAHFGSAYDALLRLLFEDDPEGINFGDNTDEYDPEVRTILPRLADCCSIDDVQNVISEEFRRWFGPAAAERRSAYRGIAERIVAELPDLVGRAG